MEEKNKKFREEFKKRLYKFTLELIGFIDGLPNDNVSRRLGDQLLRSGTSIIANFIEGQSASSKKDFINYLTISLKSSNESKLWLALLRDSKRASNELADKQLSELREISNMLASSILKLKDRK
jgi:four helix bundle protein